MDQALQQKNIPRYLGSVIISRVHYNNTINTESEKQADH